MYKKVIECLKYMAYNFSEYESVSCSRGNYVLNNSVFSIYNVIKVEKNNLECVYLQFKENGSIWVWDMNGNYQYEIRPNAHYKMIFELGWILNN